GWSGGAAADGQRLARRRVGVTAGGARAARARAPGAGAGRGGRQQGGGGAGAGGGAEHAGEQAAEVRAEVATARFCTYAPDLRVRACRARFTRRSTLTTVQKTATASKTVADKCHAPL